MLNIYQKDFIDAYHKEYNVRQLANLVGLRYSQVSNYMSRKQLSRKKIIKVKPEPKKKRLHDDVYKIEERVNRFGKKCRVKVVA